jgi:hypothetical protein
VAAAHGAAPDPADALDSLRAGAERARLEYERRTKDGGPGPVPGLVLQSAVTAMRRYYTEAIERARALPEGSGARAEFLNRMTGELGGDIEFYESRGIRGPALWLRYTLGRASALAGRAREACEEGFDVVIREDTGLATGQARDFVDELRSLAFLMKAKATLEAEDYPACIETVDRMLMPPPLGLGPAAGDRDSWNEAVLLKAEACLRTEPPRHREAVWECARVIRAGRGAWPNRARRLLYEVYLAAGEGWGTDLARDPALLRQAALGAYHLAMREGDPAARVSLLEGAVRAYTKVVAEHGPTVPFEDRLRIEPSAWFELGVCYAKMDLWHEAGFCFEAVLLRFSREKVGEMLASYPDFREALGRLSLEAGLDGRALHKAIYEKARRDSPVAGSLRALDDLRRKSIRNFEIASSARAREVPAGLEGLAARDREFIRRARREESRSRADERAPAPREEEREEVF